MSLADVIVLAAQIGIFFWYAAAVLLLYAVTLVAPLLGAAVAAIIALAPVTVAWSRSRPESWAPDIRMGSWLAGTAAGRLLVQRRPARQREILR